MTDDWDDGYEESVDHGHDFAEEVYEKLPTELDDYGRPVTGGKGMMEEKSQGDQLDVGIVTARFSGKCTVCELQIEVGDPIKSATQGGWRHAGCLSEQKIVNQYQQEKKLRDGFLKGKRRVDDNFTNEF